MKQGAFRIIANFAPYDGEYVNFLALIQIFNIMNVKSCANSGYSYYLESGY